ncbi:ribokinase [Fulvimarina sp. 2208YS6-2-32]|uniref:Ribokinase n=1 Tax=Fulvimarina uroteuthidis TaxID=3098149 RepID=A0ABU5I4X9_9HYPH|nr:ribokinase [Fulvimarina sp. 2208YS6-2-32]MDY8110434.1 ribokinase [Fulvimarina sp. 2208YS6-2-32]
MTGDVLVFGSLNVDLVCRVERIASPGETVLGPTYERLFGGKGANQAVAAARATSSEVSVRMAGAVGADELGDAVLANLKTHRIDVTAVTRASEATGAAFISIDAEGENAITVASGANRTLSADRLEGMPHGEGTVLLLQMETPHAASIEAARSIKAGGGTVVLNLAPVPARPAPAFIRALCDPVDWLIVNEIELSAAGQAIGIADGSLRDRASRLSDALSLGVIATLGARGVVVAEPGAEPFTQAALDISVEDTTGAGDTFCGVFAAGLAEGLDVRLAVRRAAIAASLACRRLGAQTAMPTRGEIETFIDLQ